MCRYKYRYPRHDPVGQPAIRGEVWERLQGIHDYALSFEAYSAIRAFIEVCTKIGNAESGFAVDQKVDLVG